MKQKLIKLIERNKRNKPSERNSWVRDQLLRMTQLNQGLISMSMGR